MRRMVLPWLLLLWSCSSSEEKAAKATSAPAPEATATAAASAAGAVSATTPKAPAEAPGSWYRAELAFGERGAMPFFLRVPDAGGDGQLKNGAELVKVDTRWDGDRLEVVGRWSWVSRIDATRGADGALTGTWVRDTPLWGKVERAFRATPVDAARDGERFGAGEPPAADVSGTWAFEFAHHGAGKGRFEQSKDGVVSGYARPGALGDLRQLSGNVHGRTLKLSQFNGNSANLIVAEVSPDGATLTGTMSMQDVWNEEFTARRVDDFPYASQVRLKKGKSKLSLPLLKKYAGKPVVLTFFATWCPVCNDATPYFVELHEKYAPRGVSFVSVAGDLSTDSAAIDRELAAFTAKYRITWDAVAMKGTPQGWAKAMPPEIENWDGYPITVFIKADGTVHAVYGGWFGPAAGEEHERVKAQFDRWAADIAPPA